MRQRTRPENPTLLTKKKNTAGDLKNESRGGFSGGAQRVLARVRRRGWASAFRAKIGLDFVVEVQR